MKNRTLYEKIGVAALAALCLFLIFRLVSELLGNSSPVAQSTISRSYQTSAAAAKKSAKKGSASSDKNSAMEMQSLENYEAKQLPNLGRDPFSFGPPPLTPAQKAALAARSAGVAMTANSAAAQPRFPLRAIGYSERIGVGPEAYLVDSRDVFIVHDGDVISKRYKVLKITSMIVEIQDGASGEKAQLPIPIVQ